MSRVRNVVVVAAAALTVAAAAVVPAVAAPASAGAGTPAGTHAGTGVRLAASSIDWGTCDAASGLSGRPDAQCAMVPVPLDYSRPNGTKIELAVSRIRHTVPDSQYQGVMLVNPGGPGGSGQYLSILGDYVPNGVGKDYDWIGFDPRGVGSSRPALTCDPYYFGFDRPSYIPVDSGTLAAWNTRSANYAAACGRNGGALLDHMTTVDSAKDMNSIRLALGAKQINYYGFSYGTYLGQVYGTLFPSTLRRTVLDSNVDPRKIWYQANLDQDVAFNKNIKVWFAWLAKYNGVYHLGATEHAVETLFYKIESKLTYHPADGKIGGDEWVDSFLGAGYYISTWLGLADVFSGYVTKHDVATLEQTYLDANGYGDDNGFAVYNAVQCTDIQYPQNPQQVLDDNWRVFAKAPFETWANNWYNAPCQYWPAKAHSTTPFVVDGSKVASALLIDETNDAATPYEGSLEVRTLFPHASLLALPGGTSHAFSLSGDACEDDLIASYLATGALPARKAGPGPDATCAPLPQPVPTGAASRTPAAAHPGAPAGVPAAMLGAYVPALARR